MCSFSLLLIFSDSPSSVPAGTVEVNGREFDIIKNGSNYINRHYKEENDLIRFQMIQDRR